MKLFERVAKQVGKTASDGAIENVKQSLLDALPTILSIGGMVMTAVMCMHGRKNKKEVLPDVRTISIITNNYYYGRDE